METFFRFLTALSWLLGALFLLTIVLVLKPKKPMDMNNERFFIILVGLMACISWIYASGC